ncbi:MAG: hypothetical protein IPM98_17045 [Lewinellaceae bacterium]|nr:hypothetical protein [Lewinellaceae bacterium]
MSRASDVCGQAGMNEIREKLKAAFAEGVGEGIKTLTSALAPDGPHYNTFVQQKAQYTNARNAFLDGMTTVDELQIVQNRVGARLLELIDQLEEKDLVPAGENLDDILRQLPLRKDEITEYHLVNCDREDMTDRFADAYGLRDELPAQFYFISACDTQMPQLFSERIILELKAALDDSDNGLLQPILYRTQDDDSQLAEILPLPVIGLTAADAFKKFKTTFCEKILNTGMSGFEDFMAGGVANVRHQYVFAPFDFSIGKWRKFLPEYFRLIIETFSRHPGPAPRFIFLFSFAVHDLHCAAPDSEAMTIIAELDRLAQDYPNVAHLSPLQPVDDDEHAAWWRDIGVRSADDIKRITRAMLAGKESAVRQQYESRKQLNMDDIHDVQQQVYAIARKS